MSNGNARAAAGGGAIYGLGIFGALVYFWQQADSFWEYLLAVSRACSGQPGWSTRFSVPSLAEGTDPHSPGP